MYRLRDGSGVIRIKDGAGVPDDTKNVDWKEYREWLAAGNTPDPATVIVKTDEDRLNEGDQAMIRAIDWLLQYLVGNGTIPKADIPPKLRELYQRRKLLRGQ